MALRLFTAKEVRTVAEERQTKDVIRAKTIQEVTESLLKEQREAQANFAVTLKAQQEEWEQQVKTFMATKEGLYRDIQLLEKRKKDILSPLLIEGTDLHNVAESLATRELALLQKEENVEEEARLLMQRLDSVATRETEIEAKQRLLKSQQEGTEAQRQQVANDAKRLSKETSNLLIAKQQWEKDRATQEAEINAKRAVSDEYDQRLKEREAELEAGKLLLKDQRATLQRAWDELRRKQNATH